MGNKVFEIRAKRVPGGIEYQGIAKSDRGTKYIKNSIVVLNHESGAPPRLEEREDAINVLLGKARKLGT